MTSPVYSTNAGQKLVSEAAHSISPALPCAWHLKAPGKDSTPTHKSTTTTTCAGPPTPGDRHCACRYAPVHHRLLQPPAAGKIQPSCAALLALASGIIHSRHAEISSCCQKLSGSSMPHHPPISHSCLVSPPGAGMRRWDTAYAQAPLPLLFHLH